MNIRKTELKTSRGILESLSNLWYGRDCDYSQIEDVIYDSENAENLTKNINSLNLLRKFKLDKETEIKIRLKSVDQLGNVSFLEFYK